MVSSGCRSIVLHVLNSNISALICSHRLLVIPSKSSFVCFSDACEVVNHVSPARQQMDWKNNAIREGHLSHFYPISLSVQLCIENHARFSNISDAPENYGTLAVAAERACGFRAVAALAKCS